MIAIDLSIVLTLLFSKSLELKQQYSEELKGVMAGEIIQHLYSVVIFGLNKQPLPFSHYTGIPILDQLELVSIFTHNEKHWFLANAAEHLNIASVEVKDCLIVGQYGVLNIRDTTLDNIET